ncbi:MAG TPA: hypothetical protein VE974_04585 [Thermoanaerobaculia bacterium]|nr:hypothetical protein [Thermoanaerobaculia bacterium]
MKASNASADAFVEVSRYRRIFSRSILAFARRDVEVIYIDGRTERVVVEVT